MRIIYLAFIRLPTEKAHGVQITKTVEALAASGAEVSLVVPGRKTAIQEDAFSYYGVQRNFALTFLKIPDLVQFGKVGFLVSLLFFSERAAWQKAFWAADIVYSRDAVILFQYLLLGRRLVYEAHTAPTIISTIVARLAYRVVVISEGLKKAYIERGISSQRIVVAEDASGLDFSKPPSQEIARREYGIPNTGRVALYVGRIDAEKGAETYAAASAFVDPNTHIVLVGDGPLKAKLQKKYSKVHFISQTKYEDLPRVLPAADVLVAPNSAHTKDASLYTSPLKLYAYLGAKKPIVASRVPALVSILKDEGSYFEPDSPASLARAIDTATHIPAIEPPTWVMRAKKILQALSSC